MPPTPESCQVALALEAESSFVVSAVARRDWPRRLCPPLSYKVKIGRWWLLKWGKDLTRTVRGQVSAGSIEPVT